MRTILTLQLIVLIFLTGINLRYSAHLCRGRVVDTNISFSGKTTACGMAETTDINPEFIIKSHCCENISTSYSFSENYIPSVSGKQLLYGQFISVVQGPFSPFSGLSPDSGCYHLKTYRPGGIYPNNIDIQSICVLRN